MKSSLFALCVLCSIAAAYCGRQLTDIDLDDTCCSTVTADLTRFGDRAGSLLVARDEDRDDCELSEDDDDYEEDKQLYQYYLFDDGTCYIRSPEPCSRFVRESDSDDDDYSRSCTEAEVTEYNANFQTAVEKLRTEGPSESLSAANYAPTAAPSGSENNDDDDDNDNNNNDNNNDAAGSENNDDDDDNDNNNNNNDDDDDDKK